jgi:hypothetical protein
MSQPELIAPITSDLRQPDNRFDIIKGIEFVKYKDEKYTAGASFEMGDWVEKNASGAVAPANAAGRANVYPVVVGNDQFDSQATGQLTLALGGGFIYRTTKFVAGSYVEGNNLCVRDLGLGEKVPSLAGVNDAIVARVYTAPDSKGVMEILVLNR